MDDRHIETRVAKLEAQNKRLRGLAFAGVMLATTAVLLGAKSEGKTLEAKRFVVVDDKGVSRARFALEDTGEPHLALFGKDGKARVVVSVTPEGNAGIGLVDDRGKRRLALDLLAGGVPRLALYDRSDNPRAALVVLEDGSGALALYDKDGKPVTPAH